VSDQGWQDSLILDATARRRFGSCSASCQLLKLLIVLDRSIRSSNVQLFRIKKVKKLKNIPQLKKIKIILTAIGA
jgi:hypothetical protein